MKKRYQLTKPELDKLMQLISAISHQEVIIRALRDRYSLTLVNEIFPRLSLKPEDLRRAGVDVGRGELVITREKEKKA